MKNGDYDTKDLVRFTSGYDYSENEIVISDKEILYACSKVEKIFENNRYSTLIATDPEFKGVHILNDRVYLNIGLNVYFDDGCDKKSERSLNYYIDYQRMQSQMRLAGKM